MNNWIKILNSLSLKIVEKLDTLFPFFLVGIYLCFRWKLITGNNVNDYYFIITSLGLGFYLKRSSEHDNKRFKFISKVFASSFFYALATLFIYYWEIRGEKAIWVYQTLILGVIISAIVLTFNHYKNGIINRNSQR